MMENISENPADANSEELAKIEREVITPLEQGFTRFDSLEVERARLDSEVKRATTEELRSLTMFIGSRCYADCKCSGLWKIKTKFSPGHNVANLDGVFLADGFQAPSSAALDQGAPY